MKMLLTRHHCAVNLPTKDVPKEKCDFNLSHDILLLL